MGWVVDIDDETTHTYTTRVHDGHDSHKQSSQVTRNRHNNNTLKKCAAAAAAPRGWVLDRCGNDPSAGSPTDTLLRLHLPLNGKV